MAHVKTAISIDEKLFRQVDRLAGEMHISRSKLFAQAIEAFLRKHTGEQVTCRLNEVHADEQLDEEERVFLDAAVIDLIERGNWEW